MRRFRLFSLVLVTLALASAGTSLAAQERERNRQRIVVPQEVMAEIQRIIQETLNSDAMRDLSRNLGRDLERTIANAMRDLPHISVGGDAFFEGFETFQPGFQNKDCTAKQSAKETKTLSLGATGSLILKNIVGDIIVKAGSGRDAAVEIVRVSCGKTDADAKLGLERVTVDVTSTGDHGSVTARYPEDRRPTYSVSTAFTVTVPAGTSINARSFAGAIQIAGVKGEISADTISSNIDISNATRIGKAVTITGKLTLSGVTSDGTIEASTVNGVVNLVNVRANRLALGAVTGNVIAQNVTAGSAEVNSMSGDIEYSGPVAKSGRYEFQTHGGEIRLALSGGFQFEGRSFSGQVLPDPGLNLTVSAGMRQLARGPVGGGGAAVVEATTFSGTVKLTRK